jgi:hypothetical protein
MAAAFDIVGPAVAHALDLSHFLPPDSARWTDALVSETRRHLAGCLNGIAVDLRENLVAAGLPMPPDTDAWDGVQRYPQLVSAGLMAHLRLRAAVSLLGRQTGVAANGVVAPAGEDMSWLQEDRDPEVVRLATMLSRAERRWSLPGGEDQAMIADLPAEHYADLAWAVAALTGAAFRRSGSSNVDAGMASVAQAAERMIARHDEGETPFAWASMIARRMRGRADAPEMLGKALAQRRLLLFAAFAAERVGGLCEAQMQMLVHAPARQLVALCRALGGSASDCRHLLIQLKPVRAGLDDAAILALASGYDSVTDAEADAVAANLRGPPDFRARLAIVDPWANA